MKILSSVAMATVLAAACLVAQPAQADRLYENGTTVSLYAAGLGLMDGVNHQRLPIYDNNNNFYAAGELGKPYSIRLVNRHATRAMVVISVDGLGLLTGKPARMVDRGIILGPYESVEINQWGDGQPLLFGDGATPRYAARNGRWGDVGQVRIAVFPERPLSNFTGVGPDGDPEHFVRETPFPAEQLMIQYDSKEHLVSRGIWHDYQDLDSELVRL